MDKILQEILTAREKRSQLRKELADAGKSSLSLSLNIPGVPKSKPLYQEFFQHVLLELKQFLVSYRVPLELDRAHYEPDADGDFFLVPLGEGIVNIRAVKELTEQFEAEHPLGRLLDVDLVDGDFQPVSSGKAKTCFYCGEQAAVSCMREKRHSYEQMRESIDARIKVYLENQKAEKVCRRLSAMALKGLLHEVSLSPKPGLVDRFDSGSHKDMDFSTFLNSSAVISVYFRDVAELGYRFASEDIRSALPRLRQLGLKMEGDMFAETNGVNTHKGAIFLLSFSLFISAHLIANGGFREEEFVRIIRLMNGDLVERELGTKLYGNDKTHGEECYERFGKRGTGIRGEVQSGLPSVFHHALPVLREELGGRRETDMLLNRSLTRTLLAIMAYNDDSNILFRKGLVVLEQLRALSKRAFDAVGSDGEKVQYQLLLDFCKEHNISPGGSADLLAVSLFVYYVATEYGVVTIDQ